MKCTKCGKEIKKTDVFCQYCGTKVEAEEKKTEVKQATVTKVPAQNQGSKGLAIASMVLGIVGILLCWCGLWVMIFPILGFIFALCSKSKSGFKIAGLITSIVGFVLQLIVTLIAILFFGALSSVYNSYTNGYYDDILDDYEEKIEDYYDDYLDDYKYASVYGEWTCTPYPEADYTNHDETTLANNYYAGTFTYESEYDKNEKYTDRKFMKVTAPVTEFVIDGVNQSIEGKNLDFEIEFINDYDEAIIMFYNTQNTYYCQE